MKRADLDNASALADDLDEIRAVQKDLDGMGASECRLYVGPETSGLSCDVNRHRFLRLLNDEAHAIIQELTKLGVEL